MSTATAATWSPRSQCTSWVALLPLPPRFGKLFTAGLALGVVELFEASNGFGVMTNTYDPIDFAANAVGVALALAVDIVTSGISRRR